VYKRQVQAIPDVDIPIFTTQQLNGDFSNSSTGGSPDQGVVAFLIANPYFAASTNGGALNAQIDPTKFDPVAQAYLKANLIPSDASGVYSASLPQVDNRNELTGKFDLNLNSKDKLSATLGLNRTYLLAPLDFATVAGYPSLTTANYYYLNLAYTRVFSPTLLNELHFVAHRSNYLSDVTQSHHPTGQELGVVGVTPDLVTGPTNIYFDTGFDIGPSENGPTRYIENTFSWTEALTWTRGKHNWKFGAGFSPYQQNLSYGYYLNGELDFYTGRCV